MNSSPPLAWRRFSIEALVIVVSILLAFAIDAWWDARNDRQAEVVLLQRLRTDFVEIQDALRVVEEEHRAASEACVYFMNLTAGERLPETAEVDFKVALVFLAARTFNPGSGAVASFRSAEGGRILQNQQIADKLLSWSGLVLELQEEEASLQKGVAERWGPFIASRTSIAPFIAASGELARDIPRKLAKPAARQPVLVDQEFLNHVLDRFRWQQLALRDLEPVRQAITEIIELIDLELQ